MTDALRVDAPLAGVRVLDLSTSYAGPIATSYIADMGASVLKVERPGTGDDTRLWGPPFRNGESAWFHACNRSKGSLAVDLRSEFGRKLLGALLPVADVLVESFNPSKLARLGLAPEAIREQHPQLIYCALSGHGLAGPDADLPGYDLTAQARSGIMSVTGENGRPPQRVSTALCDVVAGTIAAFAVAAALVRQRTTGIGELIDVSLLEAGLSVMAPRITSYLAGEPEPAPSGATDSVLSVYQPFQTADRSIVLAVGNDAMWERFCRAIDMPELLDDENTRTNESRRRCRETLLPRIERVLATRPASEWLDRLAKEGIPAAPVQSLSQVLADPQVQARRMIRMLTNGFSIVAPPWHLGSAPEGPTCQPVGPVGADGLAWARSWGVEDEIMAQAQPGIHPSPALGPGDEPEAAKSGSGKTLP